MTPIFSTTFANFFFGNVVRGLQRIILWVFQMSVMNHQNENIVKNQYGKISNNLQFQFSHISEIVATMHSCN